MSETADDPRCPECGGAIGQTATYCMHCSADLTEEQQQADMDGDDAWDGRTTSEAVDPESDGWLAPDGFIDDTLTVIVGIAGGIVVGVVGTFVLLFVTGSGWALLFGLLVWLGTTAHLVRRRTVQGAISRTSYAVALVLLTVPLIALSPLASFDGGLQERGGVLFVLLIGVALPAVFAAGIGWIASKFVPDPGTEERSRIDS